MTFKIKPDPTFTGTASIHVPGKGKESLKLVFRHKTAAEADEFYMRAASLVGEGEVPATKTMARYLLEVVAGWEDADQPFSEEAFTELLSNYPFAAGAIRDAFMDELGGARRGN